MEIYIFPGNRYTQLSVSQTAIKDARNMRRKKAQGEGIFVQARRFLSFRGNVVDNLRTRCARRTNYSDFNYSESWEHYEIRDVSL